MFSNCNVLTLENSNGTSNPLFNPFLFRPYHPPTGVKMNEGNQTGQHQNLTTTTGEFPFRSFSGSLLLPETFFFSFFGIP